MNSHNNTIDFDKLNQHLLGGAETFLRRLFPDGKLRGHEFCVGSLNGEAGLSLKINLNSGAWCDFAVPDLRGGDLISLYAAKYSLSQAAAAKELMDELSITPADQPPPQRQVDSWQIGIPPPDAPAPNFHDRDLGLPVKTWPYTDGEGRVLFYVARYEPPGKRKEFKPWSWSDSKGAWVKRGFPGESKPLYNLVELVHGGNKPVLIVEGEKAADAARKTVGTVYTVTTWAGGCGAWSKTDLTPLTGRDCLLWPDADKPGVDAMREIAVKLKMLQCSVKILNVDGQPDGWDAADAAFDWQAFKEWAKPRAAEFKGGEIVRLEVVKEAVRAKPQAAPPSDQWTVWDRANLTLANGKPVENLDNTVKLIEYSNLLPDAYFDVFHQKIYIAENNEVTDQDYLRIQVDLQATYGMRRITKQTVIDAVTTIGFRRQRDSVKEYFEALKWDGVRRNAHFFSDIYGAKLNDYSQAVSVNFLRSICARATQPGCKVDNMVVLEGAQGIGKSESLVILGGGLHTEVHEAIDNKDFYTAMQGKLIVCFAELATFGKTDMAKLKGIITNRVDRFRQPYGRTTADYPRRCIFVGDTNEEHWHDDHTGARRFWPIRCTEINWDALRANREQYLAEAMHDIRNGETWHEFHAAAAAVQAEQEARRQRDVWEEQIADWTLGRTMVTASEVLIDCLKFDVARITRADQLRAGRVLRVLGWRNKIARRPGEEPRRQWVRMSFDDGSAVDD